MEYSKSYSALKDRVEKNWVASINSFDQELTQLVKTGQISATEHQSLLMQLLEKYRDKGESKPS